MTRPTKLNMMMKIAKVVRQRSSCSRLQVGCVITNLEPYRHVTGAVHPEQMTPWDQHLSHTRILAMGYNGMEAGGKNECDSDIPGQCGCIHAEVNALIKAPPGPKALFVTTSPCLSCARLMINADVRAVYYGQVYRKSEGLELLCERRVQVFNL